MLKLALTVKWISGLLLSLLLAVGFALLAQWQVERSVVANSDTVKSFAVATNKLSNVAKPGKPFTFSELETSGQMGFLTQVETKAVLSPSGAVLVEKRFQENGTEGYWVLVPANTSEGNLFVVVGFSKSQVLANEALGNMLKQPKVAVTLVGRYLPSEAPVAKSADGNYASLSVAQLINDVVWDFKDTKTYAGFLADTTNNVYVKNVGLDQLKIGLPKTDSQVNWLSSFYAIEWTVFAGFAVFMWWRLLADSYRKQQEELLA